MCIDGSIAGYEHPYVTVDGVLFRIKGGRLQVKLTWNDAYGKPCLPGGFVPVDRKAEDVLRRKMEEKADAVGFYAEQLQTYDGIDRDPRARVISIAYLCLTADQSGNGNWYDLEGNGLSPGWSGGMFYRLGDLAFDHGRIVTDARQRLVNKLWYSDLPKYLLPDTFRISKIQAMYELLEGSEYYTNFKRNMGRRIVPVGVDEGGMPGRKAQLYRWAGVGNGGK